MGGKQKQAQRTKGNTKPSSSLRAAELLEASGAGGAPAFAGFGSTAGIGGFDSPFGSSASLGAEDGAAESCLEDSELSLVLKRMAKKDATTKLKAMQEFSRLCREKDEKIVCSVLPFWPKLFAKMSIDQDSRVREATHCAFTQLVGRVGRNLAPHLRGLLGPWLVAQCDGYAPAASAARAAFTAAFTPPKQSEAVAFCRAEIITHIEDNLLRQTAASLSDPRTTTEDEREEKYRRLLGASLHALHLFLTTLPRERHADMVASYRALFGNQKFWKFGKHPFGTIRAGFYDALAALCSACPDVARELSEPLSAAVMYSFDESDPAVITSLWTAVLHVIVTVDDCWLRVNPRKGVFPKLWSLLRDGGRGCASVTFHYLLPFLSRLPADVRGDSLAFYELFLGSIRTGLSVDRVLLSPSECSAVAVALMECVRYCFLQHLSTADNDAQVCDYLVSQQLLPVFEQSLTDKRPSLANSRFYASFIDVLVSLFTVATGNKSVATDNIGAEQRTAARVAYERLMTELSAITRQKLEADDATTVTRLSAFITAFAEKPTPSVAENRSGKSVRFVQIEEPLASESCVSLSDSSSASFRTAAENMPPDDGSSTLPKLSAKGDTLLADADGALWQLVCESCWISLVRGRRSSVTSHIRFAASVFRFYCSDILVSELLVRTKDVPEFSAEQVKSAMDGEETRVETEPTTEISENVYLLFYRRFLLPWMLEWQESGNDPSSEPSRHLLSIAMLTCDQLPAAVMPSVLSDTLSSFEGRGSLILVKFLCAVLSTRISRDAQIAEWMRGPTVGRFVVRLTRQLCEQRLTVRDLSSASDVDDDDGWKLLCLCLSVNSQTDKLHIDETYLNEVIGVIQEALPSNDQIALLDWKLITGCVTFICDLASHLFTSLCSRLSLSAAETLLVELFRLDMTPRDPLEKVSSPLGGKLRLAWITGLRAIVHLNPVGKDESVNESCRCLNRVIYILTWEVAREIPTENRLSELCEIAVDIWNITREFLPSKSRLDSVKRSLCPPSKLAGMVPPSPCWLAPILDRRTLFHSIDGFQLAKHSGLMSEVVMSSIPGCLGTAIFGAKFLRAVWKLDGGVCVNESESVSEEVGSTPDGNKPDGKEESVAKVDTDESEEEVRVMTETDVDLLLDVALAVAYCRAVTDYGGRSLIVTATLDHDLRQLIGSLSSEQANHFVTSAFERSVSAGGVWTLAFDVVLKQLQSMRADVVGRCLPSDIDRYTPLTSLSNVGTLVATLPYLGRDVVPHFSEIQLALMLSVEITNVANFSDGAIGYLRVFNGLLELLETDCEPSIDLEILSNVLSLLRQWRNDVDELFLFDETISSDVSWQSVSFNVEAANFLSLVVQKFATSLTTDNWDVIMCSSIAWLQTVATDDRCLVTSPAVLALATASFRLLCQVAGCVQNVVPRHPEAFPPNITSEWRDLFAGAAFGIALPLFTTLASTVKDDIMLPDVVLRELGSLLSLCPVEHVLSHRLPARLRAADTSGLSDPLQTLLNHCCPLLASNCRAIQLTAYHLLAKVASRLSPENPALAAAEDNDKDEMGRAPPLALIEILQDTGKIVDQLVGETTVGETVHVDSTLVEFPAVMGYLLAWSLVLEVFHTAAPELRAEYARYIRRVGLLDRLMTDLFRLMPQLPVAMDTKNTCTKANFLAEEPSLSVAVDSGCHDSTTELRHLACSVYLRTLGTLPALVRQWWAGLDKRAGDTVDRFTARYASPILCAREMSAVQSGNVVPGMLVKARPVMREVVASYAFGDATMELQITLPANLPLGAVTVTGDERRLGVQKTQWRNWMLQLTMFLTYQNGSVVDGLMLWKRNVDKRFEGVDDCMICYSVLHGTSYHLPRMECRTCHKRFHSECLYRWFDTSNNSACPLCRNLF